MKKAIFIIAALAVVAVIFPAESFAGNSGGIVAECAFLLETPDDSSTLSAVFDADICEVLALSDNGTKFVSPVVSSGLPYFNEGADSIKLFCAENFSTAGIPRSRYSIKLE